MTADPCACKPAIRPLCPADRAQWLAMRAVLYGEPAEALAGESDAFLAGVTAGDLMAVLVADAGGVLAGFVELGLRSYAEGCAGSPVPYVEGWWVAPGWRGRGVGRALMTAAEDWAAAAGHAEIASDALLDNLASHAAHAALGFVEVERQVVFRKSLRR